MKKIVILIIFAFISIAFVSAQDTIPPKKKNVKLEKSFLREYRPWFVEIPIWIPGFRGELAYGDISLEGEDGEDPGDPEEPPGGGNIWSRLFTSSTYLKFFFMGKVGYTKNRFIAQIENVAGGIGHSVNFRFNNRTIVQVNIRAVLTRAIAGFAFYQKESRNQKRKFKAYGYIGLRIHFIKLYSDLDRLINKLDINPVITEPIAGIRLQLALKKWLFVVQSDIGGFYIKENLSFMTTANIYYRISNLLSVRFGWMDWDMNNRKTFKGENLILKIHLSGPSTGLTFHF